MPFDTITKHDIRTAVWSAPVAGIARRHSDFDLNPDARAALPGGRKLRAAAVLCPIIERPAGLMVILTIRAAHLLRHPGQIAFPGGKIDPCDASPLAAALREAREEIGLTEDLVDIVGALDPYETSTGFSVTPFVGFVQPHFHPLPEPGEVEEVFEAPLAFLMNPANRERRWREWNGGKRYFHAMPYGDKFIWGATAGMLKSLSDRIISHAIRTSADGAAT